MQTESITVKLDLDTSAFEAALHRVIHFLEKIEMKQSQLADQLNTTTAKVEKIGTETRALLDKVADLQTAVANADNVDPAVQTALAALQAQADTVDALVPDAPTSDATPPTSDVTPPTSDATPASTPDTGSVGVQP